MDNALDDSLSSEMYREHILDLFKHPHNFGKLSDKTHSSKKSNPLCGDEIEIHLKIKNNKIEDVKFYGKGCAISMASASLLTDKVKSMSYEDAKNLTKEDVLEMLMIPIGPVRIKCALLCIETLKNALVSNDS